MANIEDPSITLARLLNTYLRVITDSGGLAKVFVNQEWFNNELSKAYDGQVTVGLKESVDRKVNMSGSIRQKVYLHRVNVWVQDKPEQTTRPMRGKICLDLNRVIHEKRYHPNDTLYYFIGVGQPTETHKAYHAASASELAPSVAGWTELLDLEYQKIWYSDDNYFVKSVSVASQRALMLFRFKISSEKAVAKQAVLSFEGYGTAPGGNGVTIKAWNFTAAAWQNSVSGTSGADETLSLTLATPQDFLDSDGYVYMLAETTNASNGATAAVLNCDYIQCVCTVEGITHVDIASFRDMDTVTVKPFIWRTEFTVKSWLLENIQTT
jgi:hypothetical protein